MNIANILTINGVLPLKTVNHCVVHLKIIQYYTSTIPQIRKKTRLWLNEKKKRKMGRKEETNCELREGVKANPVA